MRGGKSHPPFFPSCGDNHKQVPTSADLFSVQYYIHQNNALILAAGYTGPIQILPIMLTAPIFSHITSSGIVMKNSDTQVCLSQIVLFDELQDLLICHLLASLHPDWQLAWGQVRGLLVLFCAGEVKGTMLYK